MNINIYNKIEFSLAKICIICYNDFIILIGAEKKRAWLATEMLAVNHAFCFVKSPHFTRHPSGKAR